MTFMFHFYASFIVSYLSWMAQLSIISHFYLSGSSFISQIFQNNYFMKSRYSYFLYVPSMIRQLASPSSPMMAINENLLPFEMGQLTVISSLGLAHAFQRVMQRLKPDSSRKYIFACLSVSSLYFAQYSYLFSSDLEVFLYLGTQRTLFFLNLPTFSSLATVVLLISCRCPSFKHFRSSILFNSIQSQFCVIKGFSLMSRATCSNLSTVSFLYGVRLRISYLINRSQKVGSSIHSVQSLWMVLAPMSNMRPMSLSDIFGPLYSTLFQQAQYQSNFLANNSRVRLLITFCFFWSFLVLILRGQSWRSYLSYCFYLFNFYWSSFCQRLISLLMRSMFSCQSVMLGPSLRLVVVSLGQLVSRSITSPVASVQVAFFLESALKNSYQSSGSKYLLAGCLSLVCFLVIGLVLFVPFLKVICQV